MVAFAADQNQEVVRVADEPPGPEPFAASLFAVPLGPTVPLSDEVLVKDRQGDVGQQRRQDRTLRGPGAGLAQALVLAEDARLEERPTRARTRLSPTRRRTRSIRAVWSISSKQAVMSPSTIHS